MRFLIDENLPQQLARWLRERGHDSVHVRDHTGLRSDDDVARTAIREQRVIITKDGDFDPPKRGELVLHLSLGICSNEHLLTWLAPRLDDATKRFDAGERYVSLK